LRLGATEQRVPQPYASTLKVGSSALSAGTYSILIRTTDGGGLSYEKSFAIIVNDNVAPTLSVSAPSAGSTSTGPVTYTVTYSGADTITLAAGGITLNKTGTANATVGVSSSGTIRAVTLSSITGSGTLERFGISNCRRHRPGTTRQHTAPAAGPAGPSLSTMPRRPDLHRARFEVPALAVPGGSSVEFRVTFDPDSHRARDHRGDLRSRRTGTAAGHLASVSGSGPSCIPVHGRRRGPAPARCART